MSMNKKIISILLIVFCFCLFKIDVNAIDSNTYWNPSTEELEYSYEAKYSGIRRIWLECTGPKDVTITLYNQTKGFTTDRVQGSKDTNSLKNGTYVCKAHVATEGDNDDREGDGDITFTKQNYDPSKDNQQLDGSRDSCAIITIEENCNNDPTCTWNSRNQTCVANQIAERPCDEQEIRKVLKIFGYILFIAKVAIPLIIIGFGTFDLFKSVIDKDEKSMGKQIKQILIRIVAGFIIFFIPNIINVVFGLSDTLNILENDQFLTCSECLLEPTKDSRCTLEE